MPPSRPRKRTCSINGSRRAEVRSALGFVPPVASTPPAKNSNWERNEIDSFILANLEKHDLKLKDADGYSLVRRLYLDLVGLPPTPEQADGFVSDKRPDAYELVDELLASPHYGEKWGLSGSILPAMPTPTGMKDRRETSGPTATGSFGLSTMTCPTTSSPSNNWLETCCPTPHRNRNRHRVSPQQSARGSGIDPLEFRFYAAVDRVATTGTVWMVLTTGWRPVPHAQVRPHHP